MTERPALVCTASLWQEETSWVDGKSWVTSCAFKNRKCSVITSGTGCSRGFKASILNVSYFNVLMGRYILCCFLIRSKRWKPNTPNNSRSAHGWCTSSSLPNISTVTCDAWACKWVQSISNILSLLSLTHLRRLPKSHQTTLCVTSALTWNHNLSFCALALECRQAAFPLTYSDSTDWPMIHSLHSRVTVHDVI